MSIYSTVSQDLSLLINWFKLAPPQLFVPLLFFLFWMNLKAKYPKSKTKHYKFKN